MKNNCDLIIIEVKTLDSKELIGSVVRSTAGRDAGKLFIVIKVLDEKYVEVSDGSLRKLANPKKKRVKHLHITNVTAEEIKACLLENKDVSNAMIKKFLQLKDIDKEV
jgi:ribosomal protein L14E/L6E/L27E